MKELKVGERITIECVESACGDQCRECFFCDIGCNPDMRCMSYERPDRTSVTFQEVQVRTFTDEELEKLKAEAYTEGYDKGFDDGVIEGIAGADI